VNAQRRLGFLLIVLQAIVLVVCFRTYAFAATVVLVALFGTVSRLRLASPDTAARRWPLVLSVLFIVQRTAMPINWYAGSSGFLFPRSSLIAVYFLVYQVGQFFVRREGNRLPAYLPILAVVTLTFGTDVQVDWQGRLAVQTLVLLCVVTIAWFLAACRWRHQEFSTAATGWRRILLAGVLLVSGGVGWAAASSLNRYARDIEMALGNLMYQAGRSGAVGFSGQGRLGTVARGKGTASDRVALRVFADTAPGYLRGRAFDTYTPGQWRNNSMQTILKPAADRALDDPDARGRAVFGNTFRIAGRNAGSVVAAQHIWPNQSFGQVIFVPYGTVAVRAPVDQLAVNRHGIVEADALPPNASYTTWTAANAPDGSDDWQRLTELPPNLDPRIGRLAARVVGNADSDAEKIAAVERHFLENYQYRFGIEIPAGQDALTYFLLQRPPAHCEFFASGAAVLLRAAGVPCRYVNGFVTSESNRYGGYWVARNRDAHAWVEAFDAARGWVLVEATPAAGVPQPEPASAVGQLWDSLRAGWQRFAVAVRRNALEAFADVAKRLLLSPATIVLLVIAAAVWAVRRCRRRRSPSGPMERDPLILQLQALLRRMDRRWARLGLMRQPHETPHQFATRLEAAAPDPEYQRAAAWYRDFAAARYGPRLDSQTICSLQELPGVAKKRLS
jgi:transglutaminase-like putative cysteine protease